MAICTNAAIRDGYYGKIVHKKEEPDEFIPLGKLVSVAEIIDDIESKKVNLKLAFEMHDRSIKRVEVERGELGDLSIIKTLADHGAFVTKKNADIFVESLLLQEEAIEQTGQGLTNIFRHLGWIKIPTYDQETYALTDKLLCYRADTLIGGYFAQYWGEYSVAPQGKYEVWRDMVITDVLPHAALTVVLLAALSAVLVGLIAEHTGIENPIYHLCLPSGRGKTTAAYLAVSTAGVPFEGQHRELDKLGDTQIKSSILQSWSATENAVIAANTGNQGSVIVLDEIGKLNKRTSIKRVIFDLAQGTDKRRMNEAGGLRKSEGFHTSIISLGETSLLDKCEEKLEGLNVRVMEMSQPLTTNAEHSRRIKRICAENNGFAAPMLAEFIIHHQGVAGIIPMYKHFCCDFESKLPDAPSKSRFIEKFAAPLMTTAVLASLALDIPFDLNQLLDFLIQHEQERGTERNTSAQSYEIVLEECRAHLNCFYRQGEPDPTVQEVWGRMKTHIPKINDPKPVIEEYEVRPLRVKKILDDHGFTNLKTCIDAWKAMGVLSYDKDRSTRGHKIVPGSIHDERVYVFQVFGEPIMQNNPVLNSTKAVKRQLSLLTPDEDEGDIKSDENAG